VKNFTPLNKKAAILVTKNKQVESNDKFHAAVADRNIALESFTTSQAHLKVYNEVLEPLQAFSIRKRENTLASLLP
jgi:hypothetical protein